MAKHPRVEQHDENGLELGMLIGYAFRWCDEHQEWELDPNGVNVFDESCTLEYAEAFIETHRAKALATAAHAKLKAEKGRKPSEDADQRGGQAVLPHDGSDSEPRKYRGIYRWLRHSAAVGLADVQWEEYDDNDGPMMLPIDIRKLLGG